MESSLTRLPVLTALLAWTAWTALVPPATGPWRPSWGLARIRTRRHQRTDDRGDVPGWVLVTVMTAGLVIALWAVAEPALKGVFQNAVDSVKGPTG